MSAPSCAACGNEEPEGSRFCGTCGTPFPSADQEAVHLYPGDGTSLICAGCGNEEPEGSRFCGSCGEPLAASEPEPVPASPEPAASPSPTEPAPRPALGRKRRSWIAGGAAVALLVAAGVLAAVLVLSDGGDTNDALPTEQQPPTTTISSPPPTVSAPTLADSVAPRLEVLAAAQAELSARVRSLRAGVESFAALRNAADRLAAHIVPTQELVNGLAPSDTDAGELRLLQRALLDHLAYAEAIVGLPARPRSLTAEQAQAAIARAEGARLAYASLAVAAPELPSISIGSADHQTLLAVVSSIAPTPSPATRRTVDLVPLLVGIRPDDPPAEGRCFGPYASRASLRVSGVVHRTGFIQCGDDGDGDPGRASGEYRFSGSTGPAGSRPVRLTGQVAIDESSSASQRGSSVTWTAVYAGRPICSATVVWSGARPSPRTLDCRIPPGVDSDGFDVGRLRIQQVASLASSGSLWAGLLHPRIVVQGPG